MYVALSSAQVGGRVDGGLGLAGLVRSPVNCNDISRVRDITTVVATIVGAGVSLVSLLFGALLTYWINDRTRRTHRLEDLFDDAISAVAVADASQYYVRKVGQPEGMTHDDYDTMSTALIRAAVENQAKRAGEAREAIARVVEDSVFLGPRPREVMVLLLDAKRAAVMAHRSWTRRRRASHPARNPIP